MKLKGQILKLIPQSNIRIESYLALSLLGGDGLHFLWDCSWGPYGVSSDPKKEKVNTCLCIDFDLRPV